MFLRIFLAVGGRGPGGRGVGGGKPPPGKGSKHADEGRRILFLTVSQCRNQMLPKVKPKVKPAIYLIEGGQRPVTAAPPFWVLAVWDLDGMTGRVYGRTVC